MLTIYHYLRDFSPQPVAPLDGGMDKAIGGLAAGIAASSRGAIRSVVLCEGPHSDDFERPEGYRVRCFDNRTTSHRAFALAPDLCAFVANEMQPGLVVLNAIFHPGVFMMARLLRRHDVPYVVAPHDPYHPAIFSHGRLKKLTYWYLCERPTLRRAAAVQVLDRRHGELLHDLGVPTPVIEVVNGFTPADIPDESVLTFRNTGPVKILFLGRMDRTNKGLDLLLDAFAPLARADADLHLTLQGPDRTGERAMIEAHARQLNLADRVTVLGPDYHTRPGELAARHDLFVLPSRFEGFGLSAMEAMLAARPVVITEIAGLAPHVRECDCGAVVPSTAEGIRDGIRRMLARRGDWKEAGLRGRRYVLENLDWDRIASRAIADYRRLNLLPNVVPSARTVHA